MRKQFKYSSSLLVLAGFVEALLFCQPALAQVEGTAGADSDAEIVVTAQRREETLMSTPVAISAITGGDLEARGIRTATDLQIAVPSISINSAFGFNKTQIRGIGLVADALGVDSAVAFYVNGNVIARPAAQVLGFYDLERIEILRGPQGTLYGRNATGGLTNLITRRPTEDFSGHLNLSYGNYNAFTADGAVSGALDSAGNVLARVAFLSESRDGYGTNLTTGEDFDDADHLAVRGTLEVHPTENSKVTLVIDHSEMDDRVGPRAIGVMTASPLTGVLQGGRNNGLSRDVFNDAESRYDRSNTGISGDVEIDLGSIVLRSMTAYREFTRDDRNDIDGTDAFNAITSFPETSETFSQEFQVGLEADRFHGVAGLYYFYEDQTGTTDTELNIDFYSTAVTLCGFDPTCRFAQGGQVITKSYAAFAQGTYEITDRLSATVGLRYTSEKKTSDGFSQFFLAVVPTSGEETWESVTPRFALEYTPDSSTLIYGSVAKGFRAGTFLIGVIQPPVDPETLWNYEVGVKKRVLDNRGQFSLTGFYSDYTDLQLGRLTDTTAIVENAGVATVYGVEFEGTLAVTPQFQIDSTISYIHSSLEEFSSIDETQPGLGLQDLSGNVLPNAPEWTATLGLEYTVPLANGAEVELRADGSWRSRTYFEFFNREEVSQEPYAKIDATVTYRPNAKLSLALYGKNLTDELVVSGGGIGALPLGYPIHGFFDDPRTYGVRLGYQF